MRHTPPLAVSPRQANKTRGGAIMVEPRISSYSYDDSFLHGRDSDGETGGQQLRQNPSLPMEDSSVGPEQQQHDGAALPDSYSPTRHRLLRNPIAEREQQQRQHQQSSPPSAPLHYRTNFGKTSGYTPPRPTITSPTYNNNVVPATLRTPPRTTRRLETPPSLDEEIMKAGGFGKSSQYPMQRLVPDYRPADDGFPPVRRNPPMPLYTDAKLTDLTRPSTSSETMNSSYRREEDATTTPTRRGRSPVRRRLQQEPPDGRAMENSIHARPDYPQRDLRNAPATQHHHQQQRGQYERFEAYAEESPRRSLTDWEDDSPLRSGRRGGHYRPTLTTTSPWSEEALSAPSPFRRPYSDTEELNLQPTARFRLPPPRRYTPVSLEASLQSSTRAQVPSIQEAIKPSSSKTDDDSLFDFKDMANRSKKGGNNVKRRTARRRKEQVPAISDESDTSLDNDYGDALDQQHLRQERAQAAWKLKRKQLSVLDGASAPLSPTLASSPPQRGAAVPAVLKKTSPRTDDDVSSDENADRAAAARPAPGTPPSPSHSVSFGTANIVHHYDREDEDDDDGDDTVEDITLAGRSVNSEYTKSMESEVEDAIKDIFMIGDGDRHKPGRRKFRDHPKYKYTDTVARRQQQQQQQGPTRHRRSDDDDDITLETYGEEASNNVASSRPSLSATAGKGSPMPSRPSSRGMASISDEKKEDDGSSVDPLSEAWNFVESGFSALFGAATSAAPSTEPAPSSPHRAGNSGKKTPSIVDGSLSDMLDFASDLVIGPEDVEPRRISKPKAPILPPAEPIKEDIPLEEDIRLIDVAYHAAKSAHKMEGYEFDETYDIDIVADINFCVVDLTLPLGLVFQENEGGCWITKVLPDGSAHQTGLVHVGDQLAAIEGTSAINFKVEEVASMIRVHRDKGIELTFLRYVGPMKPAAGDLEEEGYEVNAPRPLPVQSKVAATSAARQAIAQKAAFAHASKPRPPPRLFARTSNMPKSKPDPDPVAEANRTKITVSSSNPSKQTASNENMDFSPRHGASAATSPSRQGEKKRFRLFGRKP